MIIYIDILLILNLFVDYFLLLSCSILLKVNIKKKRLIAGALLGSAFSLLILLPSLNVFLNLIVKIASGLILVLVTFGYKKKQLFIKTFLIFFTENLIFIGVMFFLWVFVSPPGMFWKNGVTYIAISPFVVVFGSLIAYMFTCVINFILAKRVDCKKIYSIRIEFNKKFVVLKALYDSGNCLVEPFSGKPVCVCEYEKLVNIFPEEFHNFFIDFFGRVSDVERSRFRKFIKLIPTDTISGCGLLPAFSPESFYVFNAQAKKQQLDCYVAVTTKKISDGEYSAIIGDFN